jgi:hypothetical protein
MRDILQFVHIGKCGGSSISKRLADSEIVSRKYISYYVSHINGVSPNSNCDYLICLRNPISRAISAFEWRKKLVTFDSPSNQKSRFAGEYDVLSSYDTFSALAENLYFDSFKLNQHVAREFCLIHHLRESISFYLTPLLPVLTPGNVFGVICQETLNADCCRVLGVDVSKTYERKNIYRKESISSLSKLATDNLKYFLRDDYGCISKLWSAGVISDQQFKFLMFGDNA